KPPPDPKKPQQRPESAQFAASSQYSAVPGDIMFPTQALGIATESHAKVPASFAMQQNCEPAVQLRVAPHLVCAGSHARPPSMGVHASRMGPVSLTSGAPLSWMATSCET